jgi:hypothetical protein
MFQRMIDDFKESTGTTLRLTSLALAAAVALFITTCFLCAAAFMFVLEQYGPIYACLSGAAVFFVVTAIAAGSYMVRKRQNQIRRACAGRGAGGVAHLPPLRGRSGEAIHLSRRDRCIASLRFARNDGETSMAVPAARSARVLQFIVALPRKGRRESRAPTAPALPCAEVAKERTRV